MSKAKRRQYGSGSLYQRASDGRWIGSLVAGHTETGAPRRITVSATTETEAKRRLDAKRREIERDGVPDQSVRAGTTVNAWAQTWLTEHEKRVRPKTYATDRSSMTRWVIPAIGKRRLDQLTPADVRRVTAAVEAAGRSSTTARYAQGVLMRALRAAMLEGHRVPERVLLVPAPAKAVHDRDALTYDDAVAVLKVASSRPDASRWVAALLQGMRQGECLGLTWSCVDLQAGTLDVSWQLQALPYADRAAGTFRVPRGYEARRLVGAMHLVRPKSATGRRVIPLVPWMAAALTAWREVAPTSPFDLVWPTTDGGPVSDDVDRAAWYELLDSARVACVDEDGRGRRYLLHEARHTTATLLLEAGVSEHVITAIMGHSSIVTTRGYQHVSGALARRAMEDVATRLGLTAG
jgi:integrase